MSCWSDLSMRTLAHIDWPTGYFAVLHHYNCCITRQIIQSLFVSPVLSRMAFGYAALIAGGCTANLKTARRAGLASPYFAADLRRVADADSRRRQAIGLHCTLTGVVDRPRDYRRPSFPCGRCAKIRGRVHVTLSLSLPVFRSLKTELFARWFGTVWQFLYRLTPIIAVHCVFPVTWPWCGLSLVNDNLIVIRPIIIIILAYSRSALLFYSVALLIPARFHSSQLNIGVGEQVLLGTVALASILPLLTTWLRHRQLIVIYLKCLNCLRWWLAAIDPFAGRLRHCQWHRVAGCCSLIF